MPNAQWVSPNVSRNGNCCATSNNCILFKVTLNSGSEGIILDIISGAVPTGSLYYQVDCGQQTQIGQQICLSGAGPHNITFCKPGNNANIYRIISIPKPVVPKILYVNEGCTGTIPTIGFIKSTIKWKSIYPGGIGDYNNYLNCTINCDTVLVTPLPGFPSFVDYVISGSPSSICNSLVVSDTVRVYFNPALQIILSPKNPILCYGDSGIWTHANVIGGFPPYNISWSGGGNGSSKFLIPGSHTIITTDSVGCKPAIDSSIVLVMDSIYVNAGSDFEICENLLPIQLNGQVINATGGIWTGVLGFFNPSETNLVTVYNPTPLEILTGFVNITLTSTGNGPCPSKSSNIKITIIPKPVTTLINY